jgi:hypothetical protein
MLPGATVPCSLTDLVAVFRPCFTAPAFRTFIGLVVGLIGQTRRRTVWSSFGITAARTDSKARTRFPMTMAVVACPSSRRSRCGCGR